MTHCRIYGQKRRDHLVKELHDHTLTVEAHVIHNLVFIDTTFLARTRESVPLANPCLQLSLATTTTPKLFGRSATNTTTNRMYMWSTSGSLTTRNKKDLNTGYTSLRTHQPRIHTNPYSKSLNLLRHYIYGPNSAQKLGRQKSRVQ